MFRTDVAGGVQAIQTRLAALCAELDPEAIPLPEVDELWGRFDTIEKLAAGAKTLLARRVEQAGKWRASGDRSAAQYLSRKAGTSIGAAKGALTASKQLAELPAASEAVRRGELSPAQTEAIADAATADPSAEARLLVAAKRRTLTELREECGRTKAAADRDQEERHRRIHDGRYCRRRTTPDGAGELVYRSTVDELAEIWSVIQAHATAAFNQARTQGRRESHEAYTADGLLSMARTAAGARARRPNVPPPAPHAPHQSDLFDDDDDGHDPAGDTADTAAPERVPVPAKIIVRIDWDAFVRGYPSDGEMSEIAGLGPVPVSLVRSMAHSGDPFLAAVVTTGTDVATVAHLGRRPTAAQRTALEWLGLTCSREGCDRSDVEIDHRFDFSKYKITALWLLDPLCGHDHWLKTVRGWALVRGIGKREMVPPGHPDHPNSHPDAARPPPDAA